MLFYDEHTKVKYFIWEMRMIIMKKILQDMQETKSYEVRHLYFLPKPHKVGILLEKNNKYEFLLQY
jgi:hypothetical protein